MSFLPKIWPGRSGRLNPVVDSAPNRAARAASSRASGMVLPAWAAALAAATAGVNASIIVLSPGRALVCLETARRPASSDCARSLTIHRIPGEFHISHAGKEGSQKAAGCASIDTQNSPAGGLEQTRQAFGARCHPKVPFAQRREAWWFRGLRRRRWSLIPSAAGAHYERRQQPGRTSSANSVFPIEALIASQKTERPPAHPTDRSTPDPCAQSVIENRPVPGW